MELDSEPVPAAQSPPRSVSASPPPRDLVPVEDLLLPNAPVVRAAKKALPDGMLIAKDARAALSLAATVWISYITFHATEAIPPKRKTLSDVDVFKGLESADMNEDLEEQLKELMESYKSGSKRKKAAKKGSESADTVLQMDSEAPGSEAPGYIEIDGPEDLDLLNGTRKRKDRSPFGTPGKKVRDEEGARTVGGMVGTVEDSADEGQDDEDSEAPGKEETEDEAEEDEEADEKASGYEDGDDIRSRDEDAHFRLRHSDDEDESEQTGDGIEDDDEDEVKRAEYGEMDKEMVVDAEEGMDARW